MHLLVLVLSLVCAAVSMPSKSELSFYFFLRGLSFFHFFDKPDNGNGSQARRHAVALHFDVRPDNGNLSFPTFLEQSAGPGGASEGM